MSYTATDRCRRCGCSHDETAQLVDPLNRWAVQLIRCSCGHRWTIIHTAPANLPAMKTWLMRGFRPEQVPPTQVSFPWREYRLEGVYPSVASTAS